MQLQALSAFETVPVELFSRLLIRASSSERFLEALDMGTPPVSVTFEGRDELEEDARAGEELRVLGALDCLGRRSEINLPAAE